MTLRVRVLDAAGGPMAGLRLRVDGAEARGEVVLDGEGRVTVPAGSGPVRLAVDDGCLVFAGDTPTPAGPGQVRILGSEESLLTLAAAAGLPSWRCVWHAAPNAELCARRGSPFRVQPGDAVFVPRDAQVAVPERLRLAGVAVLVHHPVDRPFLDLMLADSAGVPAAEAPFQVEWDDGTLESGNTGTDGRLRAPMPRGTSTGTLVVLHRRLRIAVAGLPPIDSLAGVQARLNHLNHPCGAADGRPGPRTTAALVAFQRAVGLRETGQADGPTQAALERVYGG